MLNQINCKEIAEKELKHLHNIEVLLRALVLAVNGNLPKELKE